MLIFLTPESFQNLLTLSSEKDGWRRENSGTPCVSLTCYPHVCSPTYLQATRMTFKATVLTMSLRGTRGEHEQRWFSQKQDPVFRFGKYFDHQLNEKRFFPFSSPYPFLLFPFHFFSFPLHSPPLYLFLCAFFFPSLLSFLLLWSLLTPPSFFLQPLTLKDKVSSAWRAV